MLYHRSFTRKTYTNCSDLPLFNFIKILTKGDLNQLLSDKDGWRLKPNLEQIWDDIFMEYTELSQDRQGSHIFGLIKDLQVLKSKIDLIQLCIDVLSKTTNLSDKKPTIDTLKKLAGVYFQFTEATIVNDLKNTANSAKRFVIQHEEILKEYRSLATVEQSKATEMDYMEEIALIKSHENVSFDIRTTSVIEYIAYKKNIKAKQS